jgi:proline iminopeptidase
MRKYFIPMVIAIVLFLFSCTKETFYDGGPGGNASLASFIPVSQELEKDYAFAYWDQRASGLSQGNPDQSTFTVEQFVEDLDLVVDAINIRHNYPKIVFYGISWGGALGSAYLSTGNNQDKVAGFINMDSGHNLLDGLPKSVVFVKDYAQKQIDDGVDVGYWTEARDWCATVPDMTIPDNYFKYDTYLVNTNAYRYDPNQEVLGPDVGAAGVMNSYLSLAIFFNGGYLAKSFNILELNLSPQMSNIKIPTMVIWGRHDGVNTIEMGFDAFNSIGGPDFMDKEMVILENSAHEGYIEEQELFKSSFKRFVEGL